MIGTIPHIPSIMKTIGLKICIEFVCRAGRNIINKHNNETKAAIDMYIFELF
jgi:hypothetical protein